MSKTEIEVNLVGEDNNVFNLIGITSKALGRAEYNALAKEFRETALN